MKKWLSGGLLLAAAVALAVLLSDQRETLIPTVEGAVYYQNGTVLQHGVEPNFKWDIKMVEHREAGDRFTNYPDGYALTLPKAMTLDVTHMVTKAKQEGFEAVISRERSPYENVDEYLDFYQNRFYVNEQYLRENDMTVNRDETITTAGYETRLISLTHRVKDPASPLQVYTFAYQKIGGNDYMRYLFKGTMFSPAYIQTYLDILNSFDKFSPVGELSVTFQAKPKEDPNWNEETRAFYRKLCNQDHVSWGIFAADVYEKGINETIPKMEETIGKPFDVVLMYRMLGVEIPQEGLQKAHDQGKSILLTIQVSDNNNEDVFAHSPMFDVIDGKRDDAIRALAGQIKEFGKPVMFRLNNEMNSDWTSYSGIVTLSDPELFIAAWRHIYDIFAEEGVANCIWVFNPNDNTYPPSRWNHFILYYPGDDYVQMIGLTGYNTGDYYKSLIGEDWREFREIYSAITDKYAPYFSDFPWIITEFGSSSYGGDKVQWIHNMFRDIGHFPNIKAAVWWSYADYDQREGKEHIAARPYFLDETPETIAAFAEGRRNEGKNP